MTWSSIWLFVVPFFVAAALPGPAQGTLVANVLAGGKASALPFILGMVVGNSVWLIATIFGLASLALRYQSLFVAVKWAGVAYLLYIAWRLWSAPVAAASPSTEPNHKGLLAGALLTLGNPKAVVFFGAILPQAFSLGALSIPQALLIVGIGALIDLSVQSAYLVAASKARGLVSKPERIRAVNRGAASMIFGCALVVGGRA